MNNKNVISSNRIIEFQFFSGLFLDQVVDFSLHPTHEIFGYIDADCALLLVCASVDSADFEFLVKILIGTENALDPEVKTEHGSAQDVEMLGGRAVEVVVLIGREII